MFESIATEDERGQVGIGTLIVFIAMVLVAAIAAGVLINTAGSLQSQASNTGSETQEAVANQIDVVHATGMVEDDIINSEEKAVTALNLTVKKSAGSNAIDLRSMTIQYTSDTTDKTLTYADQQKISSDGTDPDASNNDDWADGSSEFITKDLTGDQSDSLINTRERVEVVIHTNGIESKGGLATGDSATLKLIDQSGAQYTYGVSVPQTFGDKSVVSV